MYSFALSGTVFEKIRSQGNFSKWSKGFPFIGKIVNPTLLLPIDKVILHKIPNRKVLIESYSK